MSVTTLTPEQALAAFDWMRQLRFPGTAQTRIEDHLLPPGILACYQVEGPEPNSLATGVWLAALADPNSNHYAVLTALVQLRKELGLPDYEGVACSWLVRAGLEDIPNNFRGQARRQGVWYMNLLDFEGQEVRAYRSRLRTAWSLGSGLTDDLVRVSLQVQAWQTDSGGERRILGIYGPGGESIQPTLLELDRLWTMAEPFGPFLLHGSLLLGGGNRAMASMIVAVMEQARELEVVASRLFRLGRIILVLDVSEILSCLSAEAAAEKVGQMLRDLPDGARVILVGLPTSNPTFASNAICPEGMDVRRVAM